MFLMLGIGPASALDAQEADIIQRLIASVEALDGAVFIRNGSEHTPRAAAEHLRLKLKNAGARVKTADDFIRLCASRSFLSGKPYTIRMPDGTTIETEVFFRNKLKEFAQDDHDKQGGNK